MRVLPLNEQEKYFNYVPRDNPNLPRQIRFISQLFASACDFLFTTLLILDENRHLVVYRQKGFKYCIKRNFTQLNK